MSLSILCFAFSPVAFYLLNICMLSPLYDRLRKYFEPTEDRSVHMRRADIYSAYVQQHAGREIFYFYYYVSPPQLRKANPMPGFLFSLFRSSHWPGERGAIWGGFSSCVPYGCSYDHKVNWPHLALFWHSIDSCKFCVFVVCVEIVNSTQAIMNTFFSMP